MASVSSTIGNTPVLGKRIIVGVSGGIAAYKAVALVSLLVKTGAVVDVVMTDGAVRFVQPLTFQSLTHRHVYTSMYDWTAAGQIPHVELATSADLCVIAPATANVMARLAHGFATDLLSTLLLAWRGPLLVAPAMDAGMYDHPATQTNVDLLVKRGVTFIGPELGRMASGLEGLGRMTEPEAIAERVHALLVSAHDLAHLRIVVTAGGTQEPIDPVRYIGNRSSGKMGYAIASAARNRGAEVVLISGPSTLTPPAGITYVAVTTALDMQHAVHAHVDGAQAVIMSAAVADYRVEQQASQKIKKSGDAVILRLVENPDILAGLGAMERHFVLVGFAAETNDVVQYATDKVRRKRVDVMVANDVSAPGSGFGTDTNQATLLYPDREPEALPLMAKTVLADVILDRVADIHQHRYLSDVR